MKKLFTLFVAMAMITMSFAQISPKPVYALDEPVSLDQRSDWYGYTSSEYFYQYDEGDVYFVTFPAAGTLASNATIERVCFGWQATGTVDNHEVNFDPNFKIVIYVGGNTDWLDTNPLVSANTGWYTEDVSNMGTLVYEQAVDASAVTTRGIVQVDLTTPFNIASAGGQQIWVGLECLGNTCGYIGNLDNPNYNYDWRINLQKYSSTNSSTGVRIAPYLYYADDDHTSLFAAKPTLGVYVNDGVAYQPKSDWMAEIYDPDDEATYPEAITWLQIADYEDAINFYGGFYNMGVDTSYGIYHVSLYGQVEGGEPVYFMDEDWNDEAMGVEVYSGWRPQGQLVTTDSLEFYGLSYPFQLCLNVTYNSDPSYNGVDPDLTNNTYCITVSNQPDAINENTNTLSVTPNPASTTLTVANAAGSQISVYNIAGQEVMSVENAEANETLNVSNLNAGLYIVRVVNGNEVSTAKVSIVR